MAGKILATVSMSTSSGSSWWDQTAYGAER